MTLEWIQGGQVVSSLCVSFIGYLPISFIWAITCITKATSQLYRFCSLLACCSNTIWGRGSTKYTFQTTNHNNQNKIKITTLKYHTSLQHASHSPNHERIQFVQERCSHYIWEIAWNNIHNDWSSLVKITVVQYYNQGSIEYASRSDVRTSIKLWAKFEWTFI